MTVRRRVQVVCLSGSKTSNSLHQEKFIISIVMKTTFHGKNSRTAIAFEDRARLKPFSRHMTPGPHGFWGSPDRFWS